MQSGIDTRYQSDTAVLIQRYYGVIDLARLHEASNALIAHGAGQRLAGVVLDTRRSTPDYPMSAFVESAQEVFETLLAPRCAWVFSGEREKLVKLLASITVPMATRVQAFDDYDAAIEWLTGA